MERKTHKIDAQGLVLGRLAVKIAILLRGKNKPGYAPHKDMGDSVVIKNVDKIKVTGKKTEQKKYYRHSGYMGGLKEETYNKMKPNQVLRKAVYGMLPKNKLRPLMIKRLKFSE